jgi:enamidase
MADSLLLVNIGTIASGDLARPVLEGDAILIRDGRIAGVGRAGELGEAAATWDVDGMTVTPGLIDAHSHPVLGNYTPRQQTVGWTGAYLNGGVTTLISAGETHWPGKVRTGVAATANAIAAHFSHRDFRPDGIKVIGGALMLEPGLEESDFDEMHAAGVRLLGEVGLGAVRDVDELVRLVGYARDRGWVVPLHVGGASVPGSQVVTADLAVAVRPHVASHANGGPTARPVAEIRRILDETDAAVELVQAGNTRALVDIIRLLIERDEVDRLQFGTDTPSGTGVVPLGMLRTLAYAISLGGLAPELAIAAATGSTAARYGLDQGVIRAGAPADLVVLDAPLGGQGDSAFEALRLGDTPAVASVLVDGEPLVTSSRVSPPPTRRIAR